MKIIQIFTLEYKLKNIFFIEEKSLSIDQLLDKERLRLEWYKTKRNNQQTWKHN